MFFIVVFGSHINIYAQEWTTKDSLWLQRVVNGNEKIRLNDATRKAINSGTLIRNPLVPEQLKSSPSEMPIVRSFEGITVPESKPKPHDVPVGVYKVWVSNRKDTFPVIRTEAYKISKKFMEELKAKDMLTHRKTTVDDPFTLGSGGGGSTSFEDIFRTIFWPSHRAKKRNAKNANAWKTYNEYE
jgi:hypothetical protein